ncbi:MAG: diguanylate cyclase [Candidatus Dechloromonas phosphoritropha]
MPAETTHDPKQNRILAALSVNEYSHLVDDLELVSLTLGETLCGAGKALESVYFPTTCIVSLSFFTENGSSAELAMTGNEGLVGIPLVLGGATTTHKMIVRRAGEAYRLRAEILIWELDQGGTLRHLCTRYAQALMTQMAQSVVCNRHHAIDQQLCRWLLLSLDQLPGNEIDITQELIAGMLGVRREAVTEAAGKLQAAGLIQYRRGHITVIDRTGLEARVCECYRVVRSEYDRLFRLVPDSPLQNRARPNPATARQRAEARLQKTPRTVTNTAWDNARLMHELQVHQIELEMHNEELSHAYAEADALREKYADIYDFAPVGYFTLDAKGVILQLNLAGAILLGIKRSQNQRCRFAAAVDPASLSRFNDFLADVLINKGKLGCEIVLASTEHRAEAVVRIEAVPNENTNECRMVVMNITAETHAKSALKLRDQYQRALLDNFPFMVWLKDEQGRYLAVNAPFSKNYGWPSVDIPVGKTDFDISPREVAESVRADDLAVLGSGEQIAREHQIEIADETLWFETYKSAIAMEGNLVGTVGFSRNITQQKQIEADLLRLSMIDALTGLFTRRHFMAHLTAAHALIKRDNSHQVSLLLISLDQITAINEALGHPVSDAMLRLSADFLRHAIRKADTAGRVGDEQFALLMPLSSLEAAMIFAERLLEKMLASKVSIGKQSGGFTVSIGISVLSATDSAPEKALIRAEEAVDRARLAGANRIEIAASGQ